MKRFIYKYFKSDVFHRAYALRLKQEDRIKRLQEVMDNLRKWYDIPISWQLQGLCDTLRIKPDATAKNFIYGLCMGKIDVQQEAKKLPLI